jgi:hypothetical protein
MCRQVNQHMSGEGTFFFPNGDMLEGTFEEHKPKGPGVLTELKTGKRFNVEYDGISAPALCACRPAGVRARACVS